MKLGKLFKIMETESSEVIDLSLLNSKCTMYVPDFFIAFFSMSLLCSCNLSDMYVLYQLFFHDNIPLLITYSSTFLCRMFFEYLLERKSDFDYMSPTIRRAKLEILVYLLGIGSAIICIKILLETFSGKSPAAKRLQCVSFPIFHISKENVCFIKIYCFINLVVKSIPHLFILPLIMMEPDINSETRVAAMTSTLFNVAIFSYTMAVTLPIRTTPRVFTSFICLLFNAVNKFLATICACSINLIVFVLVFKKLKYYAPLVFVTKFAVWMWPSWRTLKSRPISKSHFGIYFVVNAVIFSFIYIHPFKGQGKTYYYSFYFLNFVLEIAIIYLVTDADFDILSFYFTVKVLMFVFLSTFGILNVLHKEKFECIPQPEADANAENGTGEDAEGMTSKEEKKDETLEP